MFGKGRPPKSPTAKFVMAQAKKVGNVKPPPKTDKEKKGK